MTPNKRASLIPETDYLPPSMCSFIPTFAFPMIAGGGFPSGGHIIAGSAYADASTGKLTLTGTTSATHSGVVVFKITDSRAATRPILSDKIYLNSLHQLVVNGLTTTRVLRDYAASYILMWNSSSAYLSGDLLTGTGTYATAAITDPKIFSDGTNYSGIEISQSAFGDGQNWSQGIEYLLTSENYLANVSLSAQTFGALGWLLEGGTNIAAGTDSSGNGNHFTPSGTITATNDSPTNDAVNGYGNFTRWNSNDPNALVLSNGGRTLTTVTATWDTARSTLYMDAGTWVMEDTITQSGSGWVCVGVATPAADCTNAAPKSTSGHYGWAFESSCKRYKNGDGGTDLAKAPPATGSVCRLEFNADSGELRLYDDGTLYDTITGVTAGEYAWAGSIYNGGSGQHITNFGDTAWTGTPTTGYSALATQNMPAPDVGSISSVLAIANATEANIVSTLAASHTFSNRIELYGNRTTAESRLVQFSDDAGFALTFADGTAARAAFPALAGTDNWWAAAIATGQAIATGTISHTNGAGDSTAAHGLFSTSGRFAILLRGETAGEEWYLGHPELTTGYNIRLDRGGSETQQNAEFFADVNATNAIVKSAAATGTYRYIVFAETGVCQFGKYTVGTTPFCYLGHLPKLALVFEKTSSTFYGHHMMIAGSQNASNPSKAYTRLHSFTAAELTLASGVDLDSNGLKIQDATGTDWNGAAGDVRVVISIGVPIQGADPATSTAQGRAR